MILDACVTLPTTSCGLALITSRKRPHKKYWVHNPSSEWASYDYPHAQCGNICEHQMKMFQLLHPELARGTITPYCSALKRMIHLGLQNLLSPTRIFGSPNNPQNTPPTSRTPNAPTKVDLEDEICCLQIRLVEEANDYVLLEHLLVSLQNVSSE